MLPQFFLLVVVGGYAAFLAGDTRIERVAEVVLIATAGALALRWLERELTDAVRLLRHRRRLARLEAIAGELSGGAISGPGFYGGGRATVTGRLERRCFDLTVQLGARPLVAYELGLRSGARELHAVHPGPLARLLGRRIAVPGATRELEEVVGEAVLGLGLARVLVRNGLVRAEAPFSERELELARFVAVSRALSRIARLCEPREVQLEAAGEAGERRCPYCKGALAPGERTAACLGCGTVHHADCLVEARGCTVLGCEGARRRATGPRLSSVTTPSQEDPMSKEQLRHELPT